MKQDAKEEGGASIGAGSQTLMRGLDVIEAVGEDTLALADLAERIGLSKSTTYRLATALADRGYLGYTPRAGYRLGSKLLQLGYLARVQTDVIQVAREHLETLAASTEDTVHMGVLDGEQALYLDKVAGRRRINISSRVGDRHPLSSTGLGKALMLDHDAEFWMERFHEEQSRGSHPIDEALWRSRMEGYVGSGIAFDLEENEDQIRCVAAPFRDAAGKIVGAISVSSAAQYMNDDRMAQLSEEVGSAARAISRDLGWTERGG